MPCVRRDEKRSPAGGRRDSMAIRRHVGAVSPATQYGGEKLSRPATIDDGSEADRPSFPGRDAGGGGPRTRDDRTDKPVDGKVASLRGFVCPILIAR